MAEADYVVLRAHPDLPAGFLPERMEGLWLDKSLVPFSIGHSGSVAVAVPIGEFEYRDDGAVAEIYEVRP